MVMLLYGISASYAQANLLNGKRIGIYFSSSRFQLPETYYMSVSQFLTIEEDRSYAGELKPELLIRLGNLLSGQLKETAEADTVIFLNADLVKGRALRAIYDPETNRLKTSTEILSDLDYILVFNQLELTSRIHKSVYIRENRMVTDRITVNMADLRVTVFNPTVSDLALEIHTCYDSQRSPKQTSYFDFYRQQSSFGRFISTLFSVWWEQMREGISSNCPS